MSSSPFYWVPNIIGLFFSLSDVLCSSEIVYIVRSFLGKYLGCASRRRRALSDDHTVGFVSFRDFVICFYGSRVS